MTIKLPAILTSYTPKVDNTFTLKFATNELTENQLLEINRAKGKFGIVTFEEEIMPS